MLNEARDVDLDDKMSMMWCKRNLRKTKSLINKAELYVEKRQQSKVKYKPN